MDTTNYLKKNKSYLLPVLLTIGIFCLIVLMNYRTSTLGDAGYYINNGQKLMAGENVYKDGFRSGSFGSVILYFLSMLLTAQITEFVFQVSNLIGPLLLVTVITWKKIHFIKYWPLLVLIAPSRELLVNHQINGVIYLFISIWLLLRKSQNKIPYMTAVFFAAIALDLKPHLTLPILLVFIVTKKSFRDLANVVILNLTMHLIIDLKLREITEINWIRNLTSLSSTQKNSEWYEIYNIWPLIDETPISTTFIKFVAISSFLLLLSLLPLITRKFGVIASTGFALGTPFIGMYCHLYDLAPLIILMIAVSVTSSPNLFFWTLLNMSMVFRGPQGNGSLIFLLVLNIGAIAILMGKDRHSLMRLFKSCIAGFCLYLITTRSILDLIQDEHILRASLISALVFVGILSAKKPLLAKVDSL